MAPQPAIRDTRKYLVRTEAETTKSELQRDADGNARLIWGGDCYNYALLASGHIDIVVEAGLKLHDFAALVPVVEGAGGMMCDWNGEMLHAGSDGHVIALGDPARMEDVVEALACNH